MATIRPRTWKNGRTVYAVRWRDPDSDRSEDSLQFDTETEAETFKRIIEANGGRLALAEKVIEQAAIAGPTLAEAVDTHIDHITGANAVHREAPQGLPATPHRAVADRGMEGQRTQGQ